MELSYKKSYLIFFTFFVGCYFLLTWLPQYVKPAFQPVNFSMPLKGNGMDLYAAYVGATMMKQGKSAHFVVDPAKPKADFPYPIGNTYQAYGSAAIMATSLVTEVPFSFFRLGWLLFTIASLFFLTERGLYYLGFAKDRDISYFFITVSLTCCFIILSGPLNLLIERGQLEIIIPLLLMGVWRGYRQNTKPLLTGLLLGLAIHIKLWPAVCLMLFFKHGNLKTFWTAIFIWLGLYLALCPFLPITDLFRATNAYSEAASEMVGWANISLHSLAATFFPSVGWKHSSAICLMVYFFGMLIINQTAIIKTAANRDILFGISVLVAFLAPGFMCDYVLVIILLLIPCFINKPYSFVYSFILAILFNNLLIFGFYAGVIKACLILSFVLFASGQLMLNKESLHKS